MKWEVRGVLDGKRMRATVEAPDEATARQKAERKGLAVESVAVLDDPAANPPVAVESPSHEEPRTVGDALVEGSVAAAGRMAKGVGRAIAGAKEKRVQAADAKRQAQSERRAQALAAMPAVQPPLIQQPIAYSPAPAPIRRGVSGLGITALILGIIGTATFCLAPLSLTLALLGVVFGVVGWIVAVSGKRTGVGFPVAGTLVSVIPFCIWGVIAAGVAGAMSKASQMQAASIAAARPGNSAPSTVAPRAPSPSAAVAPSSTSQPDPPKPQPTSLTINSANAICNAYRENEVRADITAKGWGIVKGTVDSVRTDGGGAAYVLLKSDGPLFVGCSFYPSETTRLAAINPGDTIWVAGECRGKKLSVVSFRLCQLVDEPADQNAKSAAVILKGDK